MNDKAMKVAMVVDRSGSMSAIAEATVEGLNAFIAEQQRSPIDVSLEIVQFDDLYDVVYVGPVAKAPVFTLSEPNAGQVKFSPRGWTALLDAIGTTIDSVGAGLALMPEAERPSKVVMVIMTDGAENKSRKFNQHQIAAMIAHQRDVYGWEFQFLAANQDAIGTAATYNIPASNAVQFTNSGRGMRNVMRGASNRVSSYGVSGARSFMSISEQERSEAMEDDAAKLVKP